MPSRLVREGILTSDQLSSPRWEQDSLPPVSSLITEDSVLAVRHALPMLKAGDPLQAYKWRLAMQLRRIRMKKAGVLPESVVRSLIVAAGKTCVSCGVLMEVWSTGCFPTIDHIEPISKGGSNDVDNLKVICNRCNSRKSDSA